MEYRRKGIYSAIQFKGDNYQEVINFIDEPAIYHQNEDPKKTYIEIVGFSSIVKPGDWLVNSLKDGVGLYPDDWFKELFEEME